MSKTESRNAAGPIRCSEIATQVDELPDNLKRFITKFTQKEIIVALPNEKKSTISFPLVVHDIEKFSFQIDRIPSCNWTADRVWNISFPNAKKPCSLCWKWGNASETTRIGNETHYAKSYLKNGPFEVTLNKSITFSRSKLGNEQATNNSCHPFESVPSCDSAHFVNMSIQNVACDHCCNVTLKFPRPQVQFLGNFSLPPTTRPSKALTTKPTDSTSASYLPYVIAGGVLLLLVVIGVVILVVYLYKRKRRSDVERPPIDGNLEDSGVRTKADAIFSAGDESYNKSVCVKKVYATNADNKQNGDNQATPKGQKSQSEVRKSTRTHSKR